MMMLTAKDLLDKSLDYDMNWNVSKAHRTSKPATLRKMQLDVLLNAFGISMEGPKAQWQFPIKPGDDVIVESYYSVTTRKKSMNRIEYIRYLKLHGYFTSGEFVADNDRARYHGLIEQIVSTASSLLPHQSESVDLDQINLVKLFHSLYRFRSDIYFLSGINIGRTRPEALSTESIFSLYLRKNFIKSITDKVSEIDKVVCILIDPENRAFDAEDIGYPNFDFKTIDQEWYDLDLISRQVNSQ